MFKVVKGLRLKIFSPLFPLKEQKNFSFQQKSFFKIPKNKLVRDCFEKDLVFRPKNWEILAQEIQECKSFLEFKIKIK